MATYNLSPAPHLQNVNNSMFGRNKGSDMIYAQDQSFNSSLHANQKTQAASSSLTLKAQVQAQVQQPHKGQHTMIKIDTASIHDSLSVSHFAQGGNNQKQ